MRIKYSHCLDEIMGVWKYEGSTIFNNRVFVDRYAWDLTYFNSLSLSEKKERVREIRGKLRLAIENHLLDDGNLGFMERVEILDRWMDDA